MFHNAASDSPWLLIEASNEGVLRFATAVPSAYPRVERVQVVPIAGIPTFTDALQQFSRSNGIPLQGLQCAIAMAGAATGETLSLVRSRWIISRSGLQAVFDRAPVILNDVAARAWATSASNCVIKSVRGMGAPAFNRQACYAMIMVEEGVGAAIVHVDREGNRRVLETEAGHMDFAPGNEREERLAKALRPLSGVASWEQVLMLDRQAPAWRTALPEVADHERSAIQAGVLARFAISLMHASGAWQGVMLTGSGVGRMLDSNGRAAFDAAFATRRTFSRLVGAAGVWTVDQPEAVLTGCAQRLAQNLSRPGGAALAA